MNVSNQNEDKLKTLLKGLGRATLRGIGICYKCGTVNGTRGLSCKNKACDVVFTEAGKKKKQSMEVCKLHTGSSPQVFSVRVREKGPDFRGFVQLPAVQSNLEDNDAAFLSPVTALCFVDSCQRLFNTNILKCHERDLGQPATTCQHIQSAMRCCSDAVTLPIDYKVLQSINANQYIKDDIWQLNQESSGAVVQRVSKTIMAVKCKVTTKHPLGFLHITFNLSKFKEKDNHICSCSSSKNHTENDDSSKLCIHYYACIAAFASDEKISSEFSGYVLREVVPETYTIEIDPNDDDSRLVEIFNNTINQNEVEIEVLQKEDNEFLLTTDLDGLPSIVDVAHDLEEGLDTQTLAPVIAKFHESTTTTTPIMKTKSQLKPKKKKLSPGRIMKKKDRQSKKVVVQQHLPFSEEASDPNTTNFAFISWLASVTERINQTMHIQFDGKPDPLIFHIPQTFFDCLGERLMCTSSGGSKRKRLPNLVTTFTKKTSPPLGTFYNYTWHITSLAHAKAIFDTPLMSLKTVRSFIQKADGTYEDVDPASLEEGMSRREGERSIRPVELKTYLKIGTNSPETESPSILSITWTPNLLPISKIGELQISFEFSTSPL